MLNVKEKRVAFGGSFASVGINNEVIKPWLLTDDMGCVVDIDELTDEQVCDAYDCMLEYDIPTSKALLEVDAIRMMHNSKCNPVYYKGKLITSWALTDGRGHVINIAELTDRQIVLAYTKAQQMNRSN